MARKTTRKPGSTKRPTSKRRRSPAKAKDSSAKLHSNLSRSARKTRKDARQRKRAERLAALPKSRWQRFLYRINPKHIKDYWFTRDGGIMALKLLGIGFAVMIIFLLALFAFFRKDLPNPRDINNRLLSQTTKFYDRTGEEVLFELYGEQNRTVVEFDQISNYAKWATVAIEDKDFYEHGGFSISGISRAAWNNVFGGSTQGGSTITQQFIKNSLLSNEQTITRKIKELILAIELERLYTKDEILSFYLNEIPYGAQEYGIEAAAQSFFGKPATKLGIAESAMLAALPQAPSLYSPYGDNQGGLFARMDSIIDAMADQGYITQEEAEKAKKVDIIARLTPIEQRSLYKDIDAPHFVLEIQRQLEEEFGPSIVQTGGLKIVTTLDKDLQKIAEETVANNMQFVEAPQGGGGSGDNAALVAVDNASGHVVAYVGSRGFNYPEYGAFDAASPKIGRQPGSSFKPFAYAEMFKSDRWGPDSAIYDTPTTFSEYAPKNFDFGYRGQMTVRQALGESRNIPAVKALYIAGVENTIETTKAMGNKTLGDPSLYGLSLVLGAGEVKLSEHAHAYSTFARGGKHKEQTYVIKIENADGEVLKEWKDEEGEQVIDEQIAYLMTDALQDDQARSGTFGLANPRLVVPGLTHTVKTGTTDLSVDGWMMGYSKHLTTGVWVGNHDSVPMNSITSWQTGPMFTEFMRRAHFDELFKNDGLADEPIFESAPEGIQQIALNRNTGYAIEGNAGEGAYVGLFPSWHVPQYPDKEGSIEVVIDKISNKKATDCTPERAREKQKSSFKWPELLPDDPFFAAWSRSAGYTATGSITEEDDVHKCDDSKPSVSLSTSNLGNGKYKFTAVISKGTHPLDKLNFKVNGQTVSAQSAKSGGTYTYTHTFTKNGSTKVSAEVIDSVLYDDTNTKTINVKDAGSSSSGISITSPSDGSQVSNSPYNFTWTASSGDGYEVCISVSGDNNFSCTSSSNENESISLPGKDFYDAYVYATLSGVKVPGSQSSTITFEYD